VEISLTFTVVIQSPTVIDPIAEFDPAPTSDGSWMASCMFCLQNSLMIREPVSLLNFLKQLMHEVGRCWLPAGRWYW